MAGAPDRGVERWPAPHLPVHGAGIADPGVGSRRVATSRVGTVDLQLPGCPGIAQPQSSWEAVQ